MNIRRVLVLLTAAATLGGCASSPPREVPASALQAIKRFGVVSVAASEFTRQHVGFTVFGNERESRAIGNWNLDKEYENQLGTAAERPLGASFVKANYVPTDFIKVNDPNGPWDAPAFSGPNWQGIESSVKAACQKESLDALFVVTRQRAADIFGGTNQRLIGVGIYTRGGTSLLHVLASVGLLDCKTGKPLGQRVITHSLPLQDEIARAPIQSWSTDSEDRIHRQLVALPPVVWESTLRNLLP